MRRIASLALMALLVAGCGSGAPPTTTPTATPSPVRPSPTATPAPLTLDEIREASVGAVTLDLYYHTDTIQAQFVDAVYDEPFGDSVLGLYTPLGFTDKSLLVYAIDSCAAIPQLPPDWDPVPGDDEADVVAFAVEVRRLADTLLCPHV